MHEKLVNRIRKCLREASQEGLNGFAYDNDKSPEEQDEDWMYFEDMCIGEVEDLELRIKLEGENMGCY